MKKWCLLAAAALLLFVGCDNKQKNEDDNAGIPKDVTLFLPVELSTSVTLWHSFIHV